MASSADVVWVDVLPSMRDFLKNLRAGSVNDARTAGRESGNAYSQSFKEAAEAGVKRASEAIADARRKEADAAGAVAVAEKKLADVRAAATATSGRLTAAEQAVERAKRNAEAATNAVAQAESRLNSVRASGTAAQVAAAEDRVAAAKRRAADASGTVTTAEARLSDVRAGGSGAASRIATAEENVARAKRNAATAADNTTRATNALAAAQRTAGSASARLAGDVNSASAAMRAVGQDMNRIQQQSRGVAAGFSLVGTTVKAAFASLATSGAVGGLLAVTAAASAATGALALLPAVATAGGAGLATLALGTMGLGDAFKAANAAANVSSSSIESAANRQQAAAKAVESAQRGVVTASRGVEDAQRGVSDAMRGVADAEQNLADARAQGGRDAQAAARAVEDAARGVVDAQRGVADAEENLRNTRRQAARDAEQAARQVESAQRGVATAERALASAQADSRRAQEDLTRARKDAAEQMQDLALSVRGGVLAERQAVLDLAEAQAELNNMPADTSGPDREQLILNLEMARLRLDQVRESNGDLTEEQAQWARTGVEGSQQVIDAQGRVVSAEQAVGDATQGVSDAQRALADARTAQADQALQSNQAISAAERGVADAVQTVRDAQQNLADARVAQAQQQQDSARSIADAERGVSDALRGVEDAQRTVRDAQENLSIAERDLARAMQEASSASATQTAEAQKLSDALARLSPNARAFMQAIIGLRPAFDNMQLAVQDALFAGLGARMGELAANYLPVLTAGFVGIADSINATAHSVLDFMNQSSTIGDISMMLDLTRVAFDNLRPAIAPLLQIFIDLAAVGSTFLPGLATGLSNAIIRIQEFVSNARATGELAAFIQRALDTLALLGGILWNVGGIIRAVFSAGFEQGTSFLHVIEQATGSLSAFLNSPVGQSQLADFFASIAAATGALAPLLEIIGSIIFSTLAPALSGLAVQLSPIANELLVAFNNALLQITPYLPLLGEAIIAIVQAFIPWLPIMAELIGVLLPPFLMIVQAIAPVLPVLVVGFLAVSAAMSAFGLVLSAVKLAGDLWMLTSAAIRIGTGLWTAAQWLLNASFLGFPLVWIVAALAAVGAAIYLLWQNSETFRNVVTAVWEAVQTAIGWAWNNIIKPAWDAMAAAATWLWQNVLVPAFNAIVAYWGLVWQGIQIGWAVIQVIWNALAAAATWLWQTILVPVFDGIKIAWDAVSAGIRWAWDNIIKPTWDFLLLAAQYLLAFLATVIFAPLLIAWNIMAAGWRIAYDNVIQPLWNLMQFAMDGLKKFFELVWTGLRIAWEFLAAGWRIVFDNVIMPLWRGLQTAMDGLGIFVRGVWTGMQIAWQFLADWWTFIYNNRILPMWNALIAYLKYLWEVRVRPVWDLMKAGWDALGRFFRWVYDAIIQPAWDAVARSLTWLKDRFNDAVRWIGDIWNGIKRKLAVPINFMINTVWNAGVVPAWNAVADLLPGVGRINTQRGIPEGNSGGQVTSGGDIATYADGGPIPGRYRGPAVDNILGLVDNQHPIKVNPREYIQPVRSVDQYGVPFMEAVRRGQFPTEIARAYTRDRLPTDTSEMLDVFAGGGLIPHAATGMQIFNVTKAAFPRAKHNSLYRPGGRSYHGRNPPHGQAADLGEAGFPGGAGRQYIANMKRWWYDNYGKSANEIIYNGIGNDRPNTNNGRNSPYSAAIQAQHRDHLHVAYADALSGATGAGGGGVGEFLADIAAELKAKVVDLFVNPARAAVNKIGDRPPPRWNDVPRKMGNYLIDKAVEWFNLKSDEQGASAGAAPLGATTGPVVDQVRSAANLRGWGSGGQWNALDWLINKESGWRPHAQNPVSSASGLFQHIDSTWRAYRPPQAAGFAKMRLAPVAMQAAAGMNYIASRYKDPVGTKAFWSRNGWYALGGQIPEYHSGGRVPDVGTPNVPAYLAPDERVLTPQQDNYFQRRLAADERIDATPSALVGAMNIQMEESNPRVVADEILHRLRVADRGGAYSTSGYRG